MTEKSFNALKPIFTIRLKLIELTPPCLGLNVIGIHMVGTLSFIIKVEISTLDKNELLGIIFKYLFRVCASMSLKGVFASGTLTLKIKSSKYFNTLVTKTLFVPSCLFTLFPIIKL